MPKELPTFQDHIEQLNYRFPDKDSLTREDIIQFAGNDMSLHTARKQFPFSGKHISKNEFAQMLAQKDNM